MSVIELPDVETVTARAAREVARQYCSPSLFHHSARAFIWAALLARAESITVDTELLYVASMFHDIGLVDEFDSYTVDFEDAGGHVAAVFAAGAGWSERRRRRLHEIIVRHMWDHVEVDQDRRRASARPLDRARYLRTGSRPDPATGACAGLDALASAGTGRRVHRLLRPAGRPQAPQHRRRGHAKRVGTQAA
ncbi:HD domain-containing protein [Nocardia brasiliensis]